MQKKKKKKRKMGKTGRHGKNRLRTTERQNSRARGEERTTLAVGRGWWMQRRRLAWGLSSSQTRTWQSLPLDPSFALRSISPGSSQPSTNQPFFNLLRVLCFRSYRSHVSCLPLGDLFLCFETFSFSAHFFLEEGSPCNLPSFGAENEKVSKHK